MFRLVRRPTLHTLGAIASLAGLATLVAPAAPAAAAPTSAEQQLLDRVARARANHGLRPYRIGGAITAVAREQARRIAAKLEIHYTPKHGSWLNMAEIELSVLARQCLDRRIESAEELRREVEAWEEDRNERGVEVKWQFTTADARIKLHRLYPATQ